MARSTTVTVVLGSLALAGGLASCGSPTPVLYKNIHASPSTAPPTTALPTTTVPTTTTLPPTASAPPSLSLETEPGAWPGAVTTFIASATSSVDMTMYELKDTQVERALAADAARGVAVRVLLNADYTGRKANAAAYSYLSAHGVPVRWARADTIFHQKTVTIDHKESAIMTGNLTPSDYAGTRDFAVIDIEAVDVEAIEATFGVDWAGAPTEGQPTGADLVWSPGAEPALVVVINGAHTTLTVENEEMSSKPIEAALEAAAARGVAVHVVMTASAEWDAAFTALTKAGVQVRTDADTAGVLYIHAKVIVADAGLADQAAYVGSQNFSASSLNHNRELGLITRDARIVGGLASVINGDFAAATPFQP